MEPNEEERCLIRQFRDQVDDVLKNDEHRSENFLMRWIRARDGNLDKAGEMLRQSFEWREANDVDSALQKPLDPFIKANYPYSLNGRDLDGRPVFEVLLGNWDIRKALDEGKEEEFLHLVNFVLEEIVQCVRECNENRPKGSFPHTQFTYLVNWEGYSYTQLLHWKAVQHLLKFASQYEKHYPEIMYSAIFINCPLIFPMFLSLLKTILAPKTLSKIEMFGSNKEEWEPALDLLVSDSERGESFGGSLYHL